MHDTPKDTAKDHNVLFDSLGNTCTWSPIVCMLTMSVHVCREL